MPRSSMSRRIAPPSCATRRNHWSSSPRPCRKSRGRCTGTDVSDRWITISLVSTLAIRSANGSSSRAACSTRTSGQCPRRSSRSGKRTPPVATPMRRTRTTHPSTGILAARAGCSPMRTGTSGSRRSSRARIRGRTTTMPGARHTFIFRSSGRSFLTRLVTQMYFPGDPLLRLDPIFSSILSERVRERLVASFDLEVTEPGRALGYRFDIVLRGRDATPMGH